MFIVMVEMLEFRFTILSIIKHFIRKNDYASSFGGDGLKYCSNQADDDAPKTSSF